MKIAVASDGNRVTDHFGHCESFHIFQVSDCEIESFETVPNPGHKPGFLPLFLHEHGENVIISGGMGQGAIDIFNENNIEVALGANGLAEDAVLAYLRGDLEGKGGPCKEHNH